jgi:hypothetical protein
MGSRICASCIQEPYLALIANASTIIDQECDFCGQVKATIDTDDVLDRCEQVLKEYYEPTSLSDAVLVRGEDPDGQPVREVLDELLGADNAVLDELTERLTDRWFDPSSHDFTYGEDPYFAERSRHSSMYGVEWSQMEHSLQTEARLVNPKVTKTLEMVFGPIHMHQTWRGGGVIEVLGPGTGIDTLFRARVFQELETLEDALYRPAREIGPPPPGIGRAGRMNGQGVSVFYGATMPAVAIAEVRPPVGSHVVVGKFKIVRRLHVLDLDRLEEVVLGSQASFLDPKTKAIVERNAFLRSLSRRLVMPVMPEHESADYLITQAVADFLATHPQLSLDGILFKSVQYDRAHAGDGRNVVLFNKASRVEGAERGVDSGIEEVSLFGYDEDGEHWLPRIRFKKPEDIKQADPMEVDARDIALQMDIDAMQIIKVKGAAYRTEDKAVYTGRRPR